MPLASGGGGGFGGGGVGRAMPPRAMTTTNLDIAPQVRPRSTSLMDQISDLSKENFSGRMHDDVHNHMITAIRTAGSAWSNIKISKKETLHQLINKMYHSLPQLPSVQAMARFAIALQTKTAAQIAAAIKELKELADAKAAAKTAAAKQPANEKSGDAASSAPASDDDEEEEAEGGGSRKRSDSAITREEELNATVIRLEYFTEKLFAVTLIIDREQRAPFSCTCTKIDPASIKPERAETVVVAPGARVHFARGKKKLDVDECLIGYVRKVDDSHQVLIQLDRNEDPNVRLTCVFCGCLVSATDVLWCCVLPSCAVSRDSAFVLGSYRFR